MSIRSRSNASGACSAATSAPIPRCRLTDGTPILLVPVAAIPVASIRLHRADVPLHLRYRGPNEIRCDAVYARAQEMGWFQHGSTIIALVPPHISLGGNVHEGRRIRMGEELFRLADRGAHHA